MRKIGIGVTTRNRPDLLAVTLQALDQYLPPGARVVVVDDASTVPVPGADFRFTENAGIARAKNKCLELLDDCDDIFLFDDDTYPQRPGWWKPYVESAEGHLMYVFIDFVRGGLRDTAVVYRDSKIVAYSHARGCMLYFKHAAIEAVGGMDPVFGSWGWEHVELSDRIYAAGFTSFEYMDVADSAGLFYSADEHQAVASTVGGSARSAQIARNRPIYESLRGVVRFVPYRDPAGEDVVITCYFTSHPDPQRGVVWEADPLALLPLATSLGERTLYVLHDCFGTDAYAVLPPNVRLVRVETPLSAVLQRWVSVYQFLNARPEIGRAWCVDATDVEMMSDPFPAMADRLYTGDEPQIVGCPWMHNHHHSMLLKHFIQSHSRAVLLNSGLLGGSRNLLRRFIGRFLRLYAQNVGDTHLGKDTAMGIVDMGLFNYVARVHFQHEVSHGGPVNTPFKKNLRDPTRWWKHK